MRTPARAALVLDDVAVLSVPRTGSSLGPTATRPGHRRGRRGPAGAAAHVAGRPGRRHRRCSPPGDDRPAGARARRRSWSRRPGPPWEAEALDRIGRGGPRLVLTKRCVDLTDLLATASTGLARRSPWSRPASGLDADSVDHLAPVRTRPGPRRRARGAAATASPTGCVGWASSTSSTASSSTVWRTRSPPPAPTRPPRRRRGPPHRADPTRSTTRGRRAGRSPCGVPPARRDAPRVAVGARRRARARRARHVPASTSTRTAARSRSTSASSTRSPACSPPPGSANSGLLDAERLAALARQVDDAPAGAHRPAARGPLGRGAAGGVRGAARAPRASPRHVVLDTGFSLETDPGDPFGGRARSATR